MPKIRVFADTNVILESFRTGCWTARRTAARSRSDNIIG